MITYMFFLTKYCGSLLVFGSVCMIEKSVHKSLGDLHDPKIRRSITLAKQCMIFRYAYPPKPVVEYFDVWILDLDLVDYDSGCGS